MTTDLKPLKYYINNRETMLQKAFSSIQGTQMDKIIPTSLKHLPLEELKAECLVQLLGMSKKRILAVLEGRTLDFSSSSETETDESDSMEKESKDTKTKPKTSNGKKSACKLNQTKRCIGNESQAKVKSEDTNATKEDTNNKKKKNFEVIDKKNKKKKSPTPEIKCKDKKMDIGSENVVKNEESGKTLLEILELEMRAKAIRALLRQEDEKEGKPVGGEEGRKGSENGTEPQKVDLKCEPDQGDKRNRGIKVSPKTEQSSPRQEKPDLITPDSDWSKWTSSRDVKHVMKTTKMITNVRKRMRTIHDNKKMTEETEMKKRTSENKVDIEGSVKEYKMLASKGTDKK